MGAWVYWLISYGCACRVFFQGIIAFPVFCRPDWPGAKAATAIWANVTKNMFNTGAAKGTFKTTDSSLGRIGWQWLVTVLTRWS